VGERQRRVLQLPLGDGAWAVLDAVWPMTEEDWRLMMAVLAAMKPGLVWEPDASAPVVPLAEEGTPDG